MLLKIILYKVTNNIITVARKQNAKLAIVDNVYSYGKNTAEKVKETTIKKPHTKKGKIRLKMELLYQNSNVRYVHVHFPDFYGPFADNSYLNYMLRSVIDTGKVRFVGDPSKFREYIYTPDGAKALIELSKHDAAYGQSWNIPVSDVITGHEIFKIVNGITGKQEKVSIITKNMLRMIGLVNRQLRESVELQYLNEHPLILDGTKYESNIGSIPKTSYKEGIKRTLESMVYRKSI